MMLSFEEMVVKCIDDQAKRHIREAVSCYEAGAYRSAIVAANVSVCFDLIAKLRSLAAEGDGEAKNLVVKLDHLQEQLRQGNQAAVKGLLDFERSLLETFRDKFDFFGNQEFEELDRLRADRNRCAHPTFFHDAQPYAPAAELARQHIRSAVEYVLSQQPRQGKAAISSLQNMITSQYFPDQLDEAVVRMRGSELGNAREPLVKACVDDLAFGWPDKAHVYFDHDNAMLALQAIVELHRVIAIPRLQVAVEKLAKTGEDDAVRFAGAICARIPEAANGIDEATKVVLRTWLTRYDGEDKAQAIERALQLDWWQEAATEALNTVTPEQLSQVDRPSAAALTRAAQLYGQAENWGQANRLATQVAHPFAEQFSKEDITHILQRSQNGADLQGSHGFRQFVDLLFERNPITDDDLNRLLEAYDLEHYMVLGADEG